MSRDLDSRIRRLQSRIRDGAWEYFRSREEEKLPAVFGDNNIVVGHRSCLTINYPTRELTITEQQMADLRSLVHRICRAGDVPHRTVWGRLTSRYQVSAARNLPRRDYVSARQFLANWLARVEPPPPELRR